MRTQRVLLTSFLLSWFALFGVFIAFGHPFFSYDSYHYMQLARAPLAASSHSVGYSGVLLLLTKLADLFTPGSFLILYKIFASGVLAWAMVLFLKPFLTASESSGMKSLKMIILLGLWIPIFLGMMFVSNAIWSESSNLLQILLFFTLIANRKDIPAWVFFALTAALSVWSYHTRYLMLVAPCALILVGGIDLLKNWRSLLKERASLIGGDATKLVLSGFLGLAAIYGSLLVAKSIFPVENSQQVGTHHVIRTSIQCALRCEVKLHEKDCSTPEGREILENARCTEINFGLKSLGYPMVHWQRPITDLFREIGWKKTVKWLVLAPFTYLEDIHDMEVSHYVFGADPAPLKNYSEGANYFRKYFEASSFKEQSLFTGMVRFLDLLFKERLFHFFAAVVCLLSIALIFSRRDASIRFLFGFTFGTFLLFSYLNSHVPFRYLIHLLMPGALALAYTLLQHHEPKTKR